MLPAFASTLAALFMVVSAADDPAEIAAARAALPPVTPWSGESEALALPALHEWATPAERSGLTATPDYEASITWLRRLCNAAPELSLATIGRTPEQRDLVVVIASKDGAVDAATLRANKRPTVFAQGGIHAGEIDGKDAGMMLLRDLTVLGRGEGLLDRVNFVFLPVLNPDGHERTSALARVNQRGPQEMGWRTTARNQNLNRDYAKADTPEMRALLRALADFAPDLYIDLHVTDGADYQYDITYGWNRAHAWSPAIATWLDSRLQPRVHQGLEEMGHIPGGLIFADGPMELNALADWTASPRYSNGYGDARHLPTILVENHSLKPFRQRVLGTYVLLKEVLRVVGEDGEALRAAVAKDRSTRRDPMPLGFAYVDDFSRTHVEFKGIRSKREPSEILGASVVRWTGEPVVQRLPLLPATTPTLSLARPKAWWIPAAWTDVIERLRTHGIDMEPVESAALVDVVMYRLVDPKLDPFPFEGRVRVSADVTRESRRETFPPGSVRVAADQPLGDLAMLLLEPQSEDSFFQWGFFHEILQRTEYAEPYAMEPFAQFMLERDPALRAEFEAKLADDPAFAGSPRARLDWFFRRSPFYDERHLLYPVAREESGGE